MAVAVPADASAGHLDLAGAGLVEATDDLYHLAVVATALTDGEGHGSADEGAAAMGVQLAAMDRTAMNRAAVNRAAVTATVGARLGFDGSYERERGQEGRGEEQDAGAHGILTFLERAGAGQRQPHTLTRRARNPGRP